METTKLEGLFGSAEVMLPACQIEAKALAQIATFLDHPAFNREIAIMPDVHAGSGSVIGFTMPIGQRVIPNVIGVDIGCGMLSMNFGVRTNVDHERFNREVRERVPFGHEINTVAMIDFRNNFRWDKARQLARSFANYWNATYGTNIQPVRYDMPWFLEKCRQIGIDPDKAMQAIGTLGGGNHFIEVGRSNTNESIWATIHCGSRNFGLKVANYWQGIALKRLKNGSDKGLKATIERIRANTSDRSEIGRLIMQAKAAVNPSLNVPEGLEWLEGEDAVGYLFDMIFAQVYAEVNRYYISLTIQRVLGREPLDAIESTHNFIDFSDLIVRKGAIRSYKGERMIIPFNMQAGLLICEGKSNPDWNNSAPHGAGRIMSRGQAMRELAVPDFERQMAGIYSTSVGHGTLDEAPGAYKDPALIEAAIEPTAKILHRVVPFLNMKDNGDKAMRRRR